jgi:hypothetical protein
MKSIALSLLRFSALARAGFLPTATADQPQQVSILPLDRLFSSPHLRGPRGM